MYHIEHLGEPLSGALIFVTRVVNLG